MQVTFKNPILVYPSKLLEQAAILRVHDLARQAIMGKIDPTDIFNGEIGG